MGNGRDVVVVDRRHRLDRADRPIFQFTFAVTAVCRFDLKRRVGVGGLRRHYWGAQRACTANTSVAQCTSQSAPEPLTAGTI